MSRIFLCLVLVIGCTCEKEEVPVDATVADRPAAARTTLAPPVTLTFAADEPARVASLALSPDGTRIAATGWGKRVVALPPDGSAGTELHRIGDADLFQDGAIAWTGDRIAVGTFSFLVLLNASGATIAEVEGRTHSVAAQGDGFVRAVDFAAVERIAADGSVAARVELADVRAVASSTEAVFALVRGVDDVVVELDPATLAERGRSTAPGNDGLAASADGRLVLVTGDTTTLLNGRAPIGPIDRGDFPEDLVSFSIAGPWMAGLGFNRGVGLFDLGARTLVARADSDNGEDIVLDGDRRIIAAGTEGVYVFYIVRE